MISQQAQCFLQNSGVEYRTIKHTRTAHAVQAAEASHVALSQFLQALVFCAGDRVIMVVTPLNCIADIRRLSHLLGATLKPLSRQELFLLFPDCACGACLPLGEIYGIHMVVDVKVGELQQVYFAAGNHEVLCLSGKDYQALVCDATWASFSHENPSLEAMHFQRSGLQQDVIEQTGQECLTVDCEIKKRFEQLYAIPHPPAVIRQISELQEESCVQELTRLIEQDSQIASQLLEYVSLQLGQAPKSIQQAVAESLGFDAAKQLTLGFALAKPFNIPSEGPLGWKAYWRHATFCARFVKILAKQLAIKPDVAYLSGLFHNIGFLLFGHLFQPEFRLLNTLILANPDSPITVLEKNAIGMGHAKHVLGMGHGQLGAWLMQGWKMPQEIIITQTQHHNQDYRGTHWHYSALVIIANQLLKRIDIGDAASGVIPQPLLKDLGLSETVVESLFQTMLEQAPDLEALAIRCAA